MEDSLVAISFLLIGVALIPFYVWIQSQVSRKRKLKNFTKHGPWGNSSNGKSWSYFSDVPITEVDVIYMETGPVVSVIFKTDKDVEGTTIGGEGCIHKPDHTKTQTVKLKSAKYLVGISGTFEPNGEIQSLTFLASDGTRYGPFGCEIGTPFSTSEDRYPIMGFHGCTGNHINAIGVFVKPKSNPKPTISWTSISTTIATLRLTSTWSSISIPVLRKTKLPAYILVAILSVLVVVGIPLGLRRGRQVSDPHITPNVLPDTSPDLIKLGPWGSLSGKPWTNFSDTPVTEIDVVYLEAGPLVSLKFKTEKDVEGTSVGCEGFVTHSETKTHSVKLKSLVYFIGISGTFELNGVIQSLSFLTSDGTRYGPFGSEIGIPFSTSDVIKDGYAITGFHGHFGNHINAIGVFAKQISIPIRPPTSNRMPTRNPQTTEPSIYKLVKLTSLVYFMGISGTFGSEIDTPFSTSDVIKDGYAEPSAFKLVAILLMLLVVALIPLCLWRQRQDLTILVPWGKSWTIYFNALVFFVKSLWTPAPPPKEPPAYVLVKQWGGNGGEGWKFIPKGYISQITIAHGEAIRSIMFKTHNGEISEKYGGTSDTDRTDVIDIKPGMRLTGISGTVDISETYIVVTSLRFYTNENDLYGPFGTEKGTTFSLLLDGHIVGFHGHAMGLVDAIGIYLKPIIEAKTEKIVS